MPHTPYLGRRIELELVRFAPAGAYLAPSADSPIPPFPALLLPRREVPEGAKEGTLIDVFLYLDSEDRPIATTSTPKLQLGEVAFVEVSDLTAFGAFVDWGLVKNLLVPMKEQPHPVLRGERHPIALYLDDTGRLAGTMRVAEFLDAPDGYEIDEWVDGEAWRKEPEIGTFVIVERRFVGLVPAHEPNSLTRGQAAQFRVANRLADGKIELSLRGHAHEEVEEDAEKLLMLLRKPNPPTIGDHSSPEQIRGLLGYSKKVLKRAAGRLFKQRLITVDGDGVFRLVDKHPKG